MTIGLFPPPTPFENNPAWQAINKELNVDFKMNIVPSGDYVAKLATVMAGNDMPDLLFFYYNLQTAITAVAGVPQFLERAGRRPDAVPRRRRDQGLPGAGQYSDARRGRTPAASSTTRSSWCRSRSTPRVSSS